MHVAVAHDHRSFRNEPDRRPRARQRDDRAARQPIASLNRLIWIGGCSERHVFALCRAIEFARETSSTKLRFTGIIGAESRRGCSSPRLRAASTGARETVGGIRAYAAIRVERPLETACPRRG